METIFSKLLVNTKLIVIKKFFKFHSKKMMNFDTNTNGEKKPCRTCTDFKTWAKQQQSVYKSKSGVRQKINILNWNVDNFGLYVFFLKGADSQTLSNKQLSETGRFKHGCPVDKDELGNSTWNLLHTMAAVYPEKPTPSQKEDVKSFFGILSRTYPCDVCAKDLANEWVT